MRALLMLAMVALGLSASAAASAMDVAPTPSEFTIQVRPGDWGTAHTSDIQVVLGSVATVLGPYFPRHTAIRVQVAFSTEGPRVLWDRSIDGAHLVLLNVQDTRWDQFAYQFSHELCHIFANYEHRITSGSDIRGHQWFEESLCELVSIFALDGMALRWEQSPPYAHWKNYAPAFRQYRENLLAEQHRQLPSNNTIADWYKENQAQLEDNPYLRDKNELVAGHLLALLGSVPGAIEALGYLNLENPASDRSFAAYLASWRRSCPDGKRDFVNRVIALFDAEGRDRILTDLAVSRDLVN